MHMQPQSAIAWCTFADGALSWRIPRPSCSSLRGCHSIGSTTLLNIFRQMSRLSVRASAISIEIIYDIISFSYWDLKEEIWKLAWIWFDMVVRTKCSILKWLIVHFLGSPSTAEPLAWLLWGGWLTSECAPCTCTMNIVRAVNILRNVEHCVVCID